MLTLARRYLRRVLDAVGPLVEAGVPVVGLEPSCLAVFRDELTNLLPDDLDARRLHANSYLLSEFLTRHARSWPLPRLRRRALVQVHCHHHAVMGFEAERALLRDMGLDLEIPDSGCCGMAGGFGYEAGEHYAVSTAAGERVLLPKVRAAGPGTLIVADGFSCRGQITAGTGRRPLHLAQVLALAIREGELGPAADGTAARAAGDRAGDRAGDGAGGRAGLRALVAGRTGAVVAVAAALAARRRVRVSSRETHHGR
ncbi:(Fe-S)-binding protein [Microbispora rosea]|uniref:(Fe-S)-binding protein n=1 Tax=Microbispora rosea TaxID=58117 RepID=UPI0037988FBC